MGSTHTTKDYVLGKGIYNWLIRLNWLRMLNRILAELAGKAGESERIMTNATHSKAHRMAYMIRLYAAIVWYLNDGSLHL